MRDKVAAPSTPAAGVAGFHAGLCLFDSLQACGKPQARQEACNSNQPASLERRCSGGPYTTMPMESWKHVYCIQVEYIFITDAQKVVAATCLSADSTALLTAALHHRAVSVFLMVVLKLQKQIFQTAKALADTESVAYLSPRKGLVSGHVSALSGGSACAYSPF